MEERSSKLGPCERFIKAAPDIIGDSAGAGTGALVGFSVGGPLGATGGAIFGGLVGRMVTGTLEDMAQRYLSKREEARIGGVLIYANETYETKINIGLKIREDDFFRNSPVNRSSFEEIFEGLLISAKTDHEEKKLPYYGHLMANILFQPGIDRFQANLLLRIFDDLSYRQLCILALITNKDKFELRKEDYQRVEELDYKQISLLHEIRELYSKGLITFLSGGPHHRLSTAVTVNMLDHMFDIKVIRPASLLVHATWRIIYDLAELDDLYRKNYDELKVIADLLQ